MQGRRLWELGMGKSFPCHIYNNFVDSRPLGLSHDQVVLYGNVGMRGSVAI